jgi:membrane protein
MARNTYSRLGKILSGADTDADEQIFQLENRLERFAHFWVLVARQFIRHRCLVRASALSYATILALIPLLAVAVGVTSSLLKDQNEEKFVAAIERVVASITPATNLETNTPAAAPAVAVDVQKKIAQQIHTLVQNTSSGALGVTGMIFLIFTAISLLRGIEETFNDIWGVTRGRTWRMQILLYWAIITLGPLLLIAAFKQMGGAYFQSTRTLLATAPLFGFVSEHLFPTLIASLALALFYKLTPNTKVETRAALLGGFFAGTAWHFYIQFSFLLAARESNVGYVYGSLALLVLLMGGLYIVWLILLFGAQIAYAYQNRAAYFQDRLADNVNQRGREFVALRIMMSLGQRFQKALRPATVPQLSAELEIPSRLTQSVLRTLAHAQLVTEIAGADAAFVPSRPLPDINAYDILFAMRTGNGQELPPRAQPELAEIYGEFARIEQAERAAAAKLSLHALVQRAPALAALPEIFLQPAFAEKTEPETKASPAPVLPAEISPAEAAKKNFPRR